MKNLNIIVRQDIFLLKIALLMFFSVAAGEIFAQNGIPNGSCGIEYTYDAAGNMILRQYVCNNSGRLMTSKETSLYSGKADDSKTPGTSTTFQKADILYPNPTTGLFHIKMMKPVKDGNVSISDGNGRVIYNKTFSGSLIELNLSNRSSGIYHVKLIDGQEIFTFKVLKQ